MTLTYGGAIMTDIIRADWARAAIARLIADTVQALQDKGIRLVAETARITDKQDGDWYCITWTCSREELE